MKKGKTIGSNPNPIQTTINKTKRSARNAFPPGNMFGFDEGVGDEYFINEIIGSDELPYKEFIKEKEDEKKREDEDEIPF
jgi:hypothetical protein